MVMYNLYDNELLCFLNNSKLVFNLLKEKELIFSYFMPKERKLIDYLFFNHVREGYFKILIN